MIDREEFVGFSKFMIVGSLLESMAELGDKLRNRSASQGGDIALSLEGMSPAEVIEAVKGNQTVIDDLLPLLPEDIYYYLIGPEFVKACQVTTDLFNLMKPYKSALKFSLFLTLKSENFQSISLTHWGYVLTPFIAACVLFLDQIRRGGCRRLWRFRSH